MSTKEELAQLSIEEYEAYEERVAIHQFEAELENETAERQAYILLCLNNPSGNPPDNSKNKPSSTLMDQPLRSEN